jgi:hypothetical protein
MPAHHRVRALLARRNNPFFEVSRSHTDVALTARPPFPENSMKSPSHRGYRDDLRSIYFEHIDALRAGEIDSATALRLLRETKPRTPVERVIVELVELIAKTDALEDATGKKILMPEDTSH